MLPPCDPAILENNPQFKRLYQNLTTNLLNPDASTRANHAQPARKAVLEVRAQTVQNLDNPTLGGTHNKNTKLRKLCSRNYKPAGLVI